MKTNFYLYLTQSLKTLKNNKILKHKKSSKFLFPISNITTSHQTPLSNLHFIFNLLKTDNLT